MRFQRFEHFGGIKPQFFKQKSNTHNADFCCNCGMVGHSMRDCKKEITSLGVIGYKWIQEEPHFLMICRRDSLGYVEFMRGRYSLQDVDKLQDFVDEMTISEKEQLLQYSFQDLWEKLWNLKGTKKVMPIKFQREYEISMQKFERLHRGYYVNNTFVNLHLLVARSTTAWETPEWGFPKGRRNHQENDFSAACREFEEETGLASDEYTIVLNMHPLQEIFMGSNQLRYKHCYFLGYIWKEPPMCATPRSMNEHQRAEISEIGFFTKEECIRRIRPYSVEKVKVLENAYKLIQNYVQKK